MGRKKEKGIGEVSEGKECGERGRRDNDRSKEGKKEREKVADE